ncbi:MAG: methyl-accepting chemotaxis protein [Candidatus Thiodiazotropha sp. (ex Dulcina madagascariensis)]|nr:methyl-accepting chemotaxis protein [Candidatus Thiodiazotropha sp. (ex Dulcina madagascariensis)]MCU7928844.1 methyl-accepting chemotaxis protein [Candidatus Thiodiazotropha sp. (ex Dulcina madagascariensis)]MCU7937196.1 methyl-accepting chemotaxis protein [Candidatus Thiodiazotropha sp. (ex Dulcina madagascariensis)]
MSKYISVQWKILTPMAFVFILIIAMITVYSAQQQKDRLLKLTENQITDVLNGYLDSMNAMMFTGTMGNREMLREKIQKREGVLEVRMLRSEAVNKTFGAGFDNEKPLDDLDRRALNGERIVEVGKADGQRVVTVIEPFAAVSDRNGTNCLTCHALDEGTILGAGRLTFSLAGRDRAIDHELLFGAAINFLVLIVGLFIINMIMRKVVIKPLKALKSTVETIGAESDLRPRVGLGANDEFRQVGDAVNKMLDRFHPTIKELAKTMEGLAHSAEQLAQVTKVTRDGVDEQERETSQLTVAIGELSVAAEDVAKNAAGAEQAAVEARSNADSGSEVVGQVSSSISSLAKRVDEAAVVVRQLAEGTQSIGQVSESITAIAEQTNLLALNAAIEAARAGEQGRGFAVVADEVRNLAQRTQEATHEIQGIIEQLVSASTQAVDVMDGSKEEADRSVSDSSHAGGALQQIASAVESISNMNSLIATAATEQTSVVSEINNNIIAISEVSHQTAEGTCQTLKESEEVAKISAQLDKMVNQFKV